MGIISNTSRIYLNPHKSGKIAISQTGVSKDDQQKIDGIEGYLINVELENKTYNDQDYRVIRLDIYDKDEDQLYILAPAEDSVPGRALINSLAGATEKISLVNITAWPGESTKNDSKSCRLPTSNIQSDS